MNLSLSVRLVLLVWLIGLTSACLNRFQGTTIEYRPAPQTRRQLTPEELRQIEEKQKQEERNFQRLLASRIKSDPNTVTNKVITQAREAFNKEDFSWLEREAGKARK